MQDCIFSARTSRFCSSIDDVGLTCSNCTMYLCDDGQCVDGAIKIMIATAMIIFSVEDRVLIISVIIKVEMGVGG